MFKPVKQHMQVSTEHLTQFLVPYGETGESAINRVIINLELLPYIKLIFTRIFIILKGKEAKVQLAYEMLWTLRFTIFATALGKLKNHRILNIFKNKESVCTTLGSWLKLKFQNTYFGWLQEELLSAQKPLDRNPHWHKITVIFLTVWLIQTSPLLMKISRQCLKYITVLRLVTIKPHDFKVIVVLINTSQHLGCI